jgi:predicted PurR-regulated permease PerM
LATPDRFSTRVFALAVVALLAFLLFRIFEPFLGPIYWAFLLAFMLFPVNRRLRRLLGGRKAVAATVMTIAVTLGIAVPVVLGSAAFARQAVELGHRLSETAREHEISGPQDLLKLPVIGGAMEWIQARFPIAGGQIQAWMVQGSQRVVQFLVARSGELVFGALGIVGGLTLTLFVLFFFFRDGDVMAAWARNLIPLDERRKDRLDRHLSSVTRAVVFGTVVTAIVQGILLGLGFWIAGLPSPIVFGVVAAVASFVPFVGTGLVWVPAALYLRIHAPAWKPIFLVVWSALVVGSADNFLRPLLVSGKSQVGTLTVFFGVLGGLAAFGFIGLFVGPVILALVLSLLEFVEEDRVTAPSAPPAAP